MNHPLITLYIELFFYQCDSVNFYRNSVVPKRYRRFGATIGNPPFGFFPTLPLSYPVQPDMHVSDETETQSRLYTPFAAPLRANHEAKSDNVTIKTGAPYHGNYSFVG
ncbi:hypothetical protein [Dickeya fangzhongdai]